MKLDLITVWPIHLDYPIWREYIHNDRNRFAKVIIAFTDMNVPLDYRQKIRNLMVKDNITFVESDKSQADKDWRNTAVNKALELSDAPWVLFMEEDFLITNINTFWSYIAYERALNEELDTIVYLEGTRPHPAFMLVKRWAIDKTHKDFSVIPDKADHFVKFFADLGLLKAKIGYFFKRTDFYHLNGLSQNMYLLLIGEEPNFQPTQFKKYLQDCLNSETKLLPDFIEMAQKYVDTH